MALRRPRRWTSCGFHALRLVRGFRPGGAGECSHGWSKPTRSPASGTRGQGRAEISPPRRVGGGEQRSSGSVARKIHTLAHRTPPSPLPGRRRVSAQLSTTGSARCASLHPRLHRAIAFSRRVRMHAPPPALRGRGRGGGESRTSSCLLAPVAPIASTPPPQPSPAEPGEGVNRLPLKTRSPCAATLTDPSGVRNATACRRLIACHDAG